ncbi:toll/interleukin-1 receptor domain-containing protein [Cyanobium sp. Alchichica 3B3-8F6]|uniref:toll/interleukin-1 receptor domain-containing protein n=1 Tax=Synechococcales TaxID=1890424 RepID=UPI000B997FE0|nr:toll/interleukin-1 receptor domain-containing protein [Synechococcus sp. 8F6]MCP9883385.1 toll/interleukin-1 receptor domain-containing protein [Cyanobium sp. Alchichica 3B3-8F6]
MAEKDMALEQVFISYSSRNRRIAEAIRSHLEDLNVNCWMAPESIMAGEQVGSGDHQSHSELSVDGALVEC